VQRRDLFAADLGIFELCFIDNRAYLSGILICKSKL